MNVDDVILQLLAAAQRRGERLSAPDIRSKLQSLQDAVPPWNAVSNWSQLIRRLESLQDRELIESKLVARGDDDRYPIRLYQLTPKGWRCVG